MSTCWINLHWMTCSINTILITSSISPVSKLWQSPVRSLLYTTGTTSLALCACWRWWWSTVCIILSSPAQPQCTALHSIYPSTRSIRSVSEALKLMITIIHYYTNDLVLNKTVKSYCTIMVVYVHIYLFCCCCNISFYLFTGGCTNPYGRTKYFNEHLLRDMCLSDTRWNVVLLRYFNPVGAHKSGNILVSCRYASTCLILWWGRQRETCTFKAE